MICGECSSRSENANSASNILYTGFLALEQCLISGHGHFRLETSTIFQGGCDEERIGWFVVAVLLLALPASYVALAGGPDKVDLCHLPTGVEPGVVISVAPAAVPAHVIQHHDCLGLSAFNRMGAFVVFEDQAGTWVQNA